MHDRRSAQSVCLAVCAQLGWCQMGKVAALLKTSVLASIMELPTNLGKASRLIAIHGMFNCEIFNYFHILDTIVYNALAYFFIVLVRIDDGYVPQTSAVGHAASMEMVIIEPLMRKDTSLVGTVNTALFRYEPCTFL